MKDDKVAGNIGGMAAQPGVRVVSDEKYAKILQDQRAKAFDASGVLWDHERGVLLITGKHPTLITGEVIIAFTTVELLTAVQNIIPAYLLPILTGKIRLGPTEPQPVDG